jgi:LemA protein
VRDEGISRAHAQLMSVYQKRADLATNLAEVVKGAAGHEASTLKQVTEARAGVAAAKLPENATPEQIEKFEAANKELRLAMAGAMKFTAEAYPQLKANESYLKLQGQIQQLETQATAARSRYMREVEAYNINVRVFPTNLVAAFFGYSVKPQLKMEDETEIKRSPRLKL